MEKSKLFDVMIPKLHCYALELSANKYFNISTAKIAKINGVRRTFLTIMDFYITHL
jgi:hypothetical protein